eukprot:s2058_g4.t2
MESVANAVSVAVSAASAALEVSSDAVAPLWSQLELLVSAAFQVTQAFWLLIGYAFSLLTQKLFTQPLWATVLISVPSVYLTYVVGRWFINLSWERGLRDSRSGRLESRGKRPQPPELQLLERFSSGESDFEDNEAQPNATTRSPTQSFDREMASVLQEKQRLTGSGSGLLLSAAGASGSFGIGDAEAECVRFLESQMEDVVFAAGQCIFDHGDPRSAFLVVKKGEVLVQPGNRPSSDVYTVGPGNAIVGLLYVLASLQSQCSDDTDPPVPCTVHSSSAAAGAEGATVAKLQVECFSDAFDKFPKAMQWLVQRLCIRLSTVVFQTLSTYFGLRREFMIPSSSRILDTPDASTPPASAFRELLGAGAESEECDLAETIVRPAGDLAFPPQLRAKHLMILLAGDLVVEQSGEPLKGMVSPGDAIGELSILTDKPSPIQYRCQSTCTFAALPREACQRLLARFPRSFTLTLLHLIVGRTATWLHRVDACLEWLAVEGSRCLYRQGDPMCGFFIVLSGRLVALEDAADSAPVPRMPQLRSRAVPSPPGIRVREVLLRGSLCGELDCLRNATYSQTVQASRDTEVCRVSPMLLQLVALEFPRAILHFSSQIGRKPPQSEASASAKYKTTITVVPATADVDINRVCSRLTAALNVLGNAMHITPSTDLFCAAPGVQGAVRNLDEGRLARLLADLEERNHWLVYEAEAPGSKGVTDWTRRCVRQADIILVATNFNGQGRGDVPQTLNEKHVRDAAPLFVTRELLLLHKGVQGKSGKVSKLSSMDDWFVGAAARADSLRPGVTGFVRHHLFAPHRGGGMMRSTRHYLNPRQWASSWHHVRVGHGDSVDWNRCARLLAGKAIGVCFGGGGARGNCHFGVIKAMQELGIPIDIVSGTSFGALAGAMYSMSAPEPSSLPALVKRVMTKQFSARKMMLDLNFPRTAYFTGAYLNSVLKEIFARRRLEDLLIPFACTSTDIVHFEEKVHRDGPLWRVIRASMSLVGFVPPIPHQERREDGKVSTTLLVDGGYVNQYPIEALKDHGAGTVICIVACPDYAPVCTDYGDVVRGGLVSLQRRFGCCRRASGDPPSQAEIQERLMFLVEAMKESHSSRADLVICPDITNYGLLDFAKFEEISQSGYEAALPELKAWLRQAPEAVHATISADVDQAAEKSVNEVEYGSRRGYRSWRTSASQAARRLLTSPRLRSHSAGSNLHLQASDADYEAENEG